MEWTPERAWALEQMWLWGIPSSTISHNLGGVSRNAVMGRVNRTGLMGRSGERIGRQLADAEIDADELGSVVGELMHEPYDRGNALHRHAEICIACLLVGHSIEAVTKATGRRRDDVETTMEAMEHNGVWRRGAPPPPAWWHHGEGWMAFILDMMTIEGMIVAHDAERHGGRAYSRAEATDGDA